MRIKNITSVKAVHAKHVPHVKYLIGAYEDGDFWASGETEDIDQAARILKQKQDADDSAHWGIVMSTTTFTPVTVA